MSMGYDVDDPRDEHYRSMFASKIYSKKENPMQLTSIELHDDGMRLVKKSETTVGHYPMVQLHNPEHIADVIQEKRKRALIQETNVRLWS